MYLMHSLNVDAKLLGILLAVVDEKLGAVDNVLDDSEVDLAMELEPGHVLGVAVGGAVILSKPVNFWVKIILKQIKVTFSVKLTTLILYFITICNCVLYFHVLYILCTLSLCPVQLSDPFSCQS